MLLNPVPTNVIKVCLFRVIRSGHTASELQCIARNGAKIQSNIMRCKSINGQAGWTAEVLFTSPILQLTQLKVRQSRNDFFKPTILPKTNKQIQFYYYDTSGRLVFVCFFGRNRRHQKTISKLTDL